MATEDKDLLMRRVAAWLAVMIVIGFFGIMVLLAVVSIPPANKDTLIQMVGALILAFGGLMGYLYGTSKNAESQNRTIAAQLAAAAPLPLAGPVTVTADPTNPLPVREVTTP